MTLEQFLSLTELEKVGALNNQGVFLAERRICANQIYLYAINYFYVELLHDFSGLHGNGLYIHRVFEDKRCLDDYLPAMDAATQQL